MFRRVIWFWVKLRCHLPTAVVCACEISQIHLCDVGEGGWVERRERGRGWDARFIPTVGTGVGETEIMTMMW